MTVRGENPWPPVGRNQWPLTVVEGVEVWDRICRLLASLRGELVGSVQAGSSRQVRGTIRRQHKEVGISDLSFGRRSRAMAPCAPPSPTHAPAWWSALWFRC